MLTPFSLIFPLLSLLFFCFPRFFAPSPVRHPQCRRRIGPAEWSSNLLAARRRQSKRRRQRRELYALPSPHFSFLFVLLWWIFLLFLFFPFPSLFVFLLCAARLQRLTATELIVLKRFLGPSTAAAPAIAAAAARPAASHARAPANRSGCTFIDLYRWITASQPASQSSSSTASIFAAPFPAFLDTFFSVRHLFSHPYMYMYSS